MRKLGTLLTPQPIRARGGRRCHRKVRLYIPTEMRTLPFPSPCSKSTGHQTVKSLWEEEWSEVGNGDEGIKCVSTKKGNVIKYHPALLQWKIWSLQTAWLMQKLGEHPLIQNQFPLFDHQHPSYWSTRREDSKTASRGETQESVLNRTGWDKPWQSKCFVIIFPWDNTATTVYINGWVNSNKELQSYTYQRLPRVSFL